MRPSHGPHARKPLRLLALGGASLVDAGGMTVIEQRRRLALLMLIAGGREKGVYRDKLVSYLSPESSSESARHALHQLLYYVRQQAGEDVLVGTDPLRLSSDVATSDVGEFEDALDRGDLDAAVALYRGPFLDGFHVADSLEFEEWSASERARLAARYAVGADPFDGRAAAGLIRAYGSAGDIAAAIRHAATYDSAMRSELNTEPDPKLVAYVAELRATRPAAAQDGPAGAAPSIDDSAGSPTGTGEVENARAWSVSPTRRSRAVLPIAAVAMLAVGGAAAWRATRERPVANPPPLPAHDSVRLRVVTASVVSDAATSALAQNVRNTALAAMANDPWLFVVTPEAWRAQAPLIGLADSVLALPDTIRKYARKTRTHAIVDFTVVRAGSGYVITAEARSASTDSSLGVIAEAAAGAVDMPNAMRRLGEELRHRLVAARSVLPPTRWSLNATDRPAQAIELFVEGRSEANRANFIEAARRARAATEVDPTFAQAWRLVHSALYNAGLSVDDQLHAIAEAFRYSNTVRAPFWRLDIVSAYYRAIGDHERALVFYDSIARIAPVQNTNAGMAYGMLRRYDLATRGYRRYTNAAPKGTITAAHPNLVSSLLDEGKVAEAKTEVAWMVKTDSMHPRTFQGRAYVFTVLREWDSLRVLGKSQLRSARTATDSAPGLQWVGNAAIGRGQFAAFDSMARLTAALVERHGSSGDYLAGQLTRARVRALIAGDSVRARAIADSGLATVPWESLKPMDRPYLAMLLYLASVRDVRRGAELAREWTRTTPTKFKLRDSLNVLVGRGELALAAGKPHEALQWFRIADVRGCETCFYPRYARALDAMGETDSARVWFERYTRTHTHSNAIDDAVELPHAYRRLGELAAVHGNGPAAVAWYKRFVDLWAVSDTPALQGQVREVSERIHRLQTPLTR
ncbi:MAG: transcriptional activator protein [Geminicoccaceae bacterium]|nr:transcriptional activator protein [Geminicoccaceae bacterium]